jgi:mycothiol system anti-sigma-R factor
LSEISCEEVLKQIDFYLTVELPPEEVDQIAGHLVDCGSCDDRVQLHLRLREVIARKCGEIAAPDTVLARVRSMLKEQYRA